MRIGFIEMDNESDNIFFAPFVTCRSVHILYLTFNIRTSFYAGVVSTLYKIHLLISESYFKHTLTVTAKMKLTTVRYLGISPSSLGALMPRPAKHLSMLINLTGTRYRMHLHPNWQSSLYKQFDPSFQKTYIQTYLFLPGNENCIHRNGYFPK